MSHGVITKAVNSSQSEPNALSAAKKKENAQWTVCDWQIPSGLISGPSEFFVRKNYLSVELPVGQWTHFTPFYQKDLQTVKESFCHLFFFANKIRFFSFTRKKEASSWMFTIIICSDEYCPFFPQLTSQLCPSKAGHE